MAYAIWKLLDRIGYELVQYQGRLHETCQRCVRLARDFARERQGTREACQAVRRYANGKWILLHEWGKRCWLRLQEERRLQKVFESVKSQVQMGTSCHWIRPLAVDTKDLFWQSKLNEQTKMLHLEMQQMHAKLREYQEYVKIIAAYKQKFVGDDKQYHGILRVWQKDLDAIFTVAERLSK